jgi:ubiquinone/menaquinone biosynthesis C-methylase UbiE
MDSLFSTTKQSRSLRMDLNEAKQFIAPVVEPDDLVWADIGAGTGLFTTAICEIVDNVRVYAVDKSPHALWSLEARAGTTIHVVEGDFAGSMEIPQVGAILLANALHYAPDPVAVLSNVSEYLQPGGKLVLIEYETSRANRWVPYPIVFESFVGMCDRVSLQEPELVASRPTMYGHEHMYLALTKKPV